MNKLCNDIDLKHLNQGCNPNYHCDYLPNTIRFILLKKTKKGVWKIKINGEGKWITADYNEERKTIQWTH